jgi:hypothetical protein
LIIIISLEVARFIKVRSCCSKKAIKDNTGSCSYKQDIDKENDVNSENPNKIMDYENNQPELQISKHDFQASELKVYHN